MQTDYVRSWIDKTQEDINVGYMEWEKEIKL